MAGALGENYTVQIGDGASPEVFTDIACQGDATLNTGVSLEISRTKNCKHPFFRESGYTAQFTSELEAPLDATQTSVFAAANGKTLQGVQVTSSETGVPQWVGQAYVAFDPVTMPTEGIATITITVAWVDDPTYSVTA